MTARRVQWLQLVKRVVELAMGIVVAVLVLLPGSAAADSSSDNDSGGPLSGDIGGYLNFSYSPPTTSSDEFSRDFRMRLGAGLQMGQLTIGVGSSLGLLKPQSLSRHGDLERIYVGLAGEAAWFFGKGAGFRPFVRLASERQWISGREVMRVCADFDVCETGTWRDDEGYRGLSTTVGAGVEYSLGWRGRGLVSVVGFSAELSYERVVFTVVDQKASDDFFGVNFTFRFGTERGL